MRTTADLLKRIGAEGAELELSPHTISHNTSRGDVLRMRALKVVTTEEQSETVLNGLIEALTETPPEYATSTTAEFKSIPFQNTVINRYGIGELVVRQNYFLHETTATSVVNVGKGDEIFKSKMGNEDRYDG